MRGSKESKAAQRPFKPHPHPHPPDSYKCLTFPPPGWISCLGATQTRPAGPNPTLTPSPVPDMATGYSLLPHRSTSLPLSLSLSRPALAERSCVMVGSFNTTPPSLSPLSLSLSLSLFIYPPPVLPSIIHCITTSRTIHCHHSCLHMPLTRPHTSRLPLPPLTIECHVLLIATRLPDPMARVGERERESLNNGRW